MSKVILNGQSVDFEACVMLMDDAKKFTRSWFAWANTIFGELLWKLYKDKPQLLNARNKLN